MKSPTTNTTLQFPQKQPQNGLYGKSPMNLLPKLRELSNLECRVFLFLTTLANFKREPLGMVECQSISDLAKTIGVPRKSFYRAIGGLTKCGLVTRPGPDTCVVVTHYLCHEDTPPVSPGHTPVSSGHTISPQPQPSIGSCEPPRRSEEVSEEEVKKRGRKSAPPSPLSGLVWWNKVKREVELKPGAIERLKRELDWSLGEEHLRYMLTEAELQMGWGRLNGHLIGAPFKTNPRTLPAFVLNWFTTDLRQKNLNPQRGKPLAQRIEEKTRERMNDGIEEGDQKDNGFTQQLLESGDFRRHS